jgi:enoyl-CoA hydratase
MGTEPHLLVEREGHVVVVTMNRPQAKNAFSLEMLVRMADAWDLIDGDPEVRVAILTGAGGAFCAGADLKAMYSGEASEWSDRLKKEPDLHWKALMRHYRVKKPLIAACEGAAVAGGTEILQGTDIRVGAESAKFGVAEARWGLFPLGGSTVRLQRQIPLTHAMDLLLTGRHITADEAFRMGLISRVVPDGQALTEAKKIAAQIAANGPLAVQAIKRSVLATAALPEVDALKIELEIGQPIFKTEDAREGPRAFAEKRTPVFTGK